MNFLPDAVLPPFDVAVMPDNAEYRIAYDLTYHRMVDAPPLGYEIRTATIYRRIKEHLLDFGFIDHQYSVRRNMSCSSAHTWNAIMGLRVVGVFPASFRKVEMLVSLHPTWDATEGMRNGGVYSPFLLGPTPAFLSRNAASPLPFGGPPQAFNGDWHWVL